MPPTYLPAFRSLFPPQRQFKALSGLPNGLYPGIDETRSGYAFRAGPFRSLSVKGS